MADKQLYPLTEKWEDWVSFRKLNRWPSYKTDGAKNKLRAFPVEVQDAAIEQSMDAHWMILKPKTEPSRGTRGEKIIAATRLNVDHDSLLYRYISQQIMRMYSLSMAFPPAAEFTTMTVVAFHDAMVKKKLTDEDVPRLQMAFDEHVLQSREFPKPYDIISRLPMKPTNIKRLENISPEQAEINKTKIRELAKLIGVRNVK